ncbi:MAG: hypothetical protein M1819_000456 [Sarea resinae]|nr:MAG: hypothetical protein M1819_000456 [Sarea resinae]
MSVTTTTNPTSTHLTTLLSDYELHHSGDANPPQPPNARSIPPQLAPNDNPPSWPHDHRRIPSYRPLNTTLNPAERPWGGNRFETGIIFIMLHGVRINGTVSRAWSSTGGKLFPGAFRYQIGGEW